MANFDVSDYGEGLGALTKRADHILTYLNNLRRVDFLNYQWRTFFPDDSYKGFTNYVIKGLDVVAEVAEGSFNSASMKETNDVPQIEFLGKHQSRFMTKDQ
jgi:hypothetical protein